MESRLRFSSPGRFSAEDLGRGAWRLTGAGAPNIDIFVQGVEAAAAQTLIGAGVNGLGEPGIEWLDDGAILTLTSAGDVRCFKVRSAIVHEPRAQLYGALPLASFDPKARRFWRRIFRLVAIPGGRYCLGFLARRAKR
jgi:hypothetical protein